MKRSTIEELSEKRAALGIQVKRLAEEDISSVLGRGPIKNSDLINRLAQELNILDSAIDRLRGYEQH